MRWLLILLVLLPIPQRLGPEGAVVRAELSARAAPPAAGRVAKEEFVARASPAAPGVPPARVGPSVRAVPSAVRAVEPEVLALRAELGRAVRSAGWRSARWSILVVSLDRGDTLFALDPDLSLAPASNLKLFTTAAALYYLGPEFRYTTFLLTDGVLEGGVLRGDLIVYGTGDPTLSDRFFGSKTAVWEWLADTLAARGVRAVEGAVVGDASYFAGPGTGVGWQESYMNASYAAPASALSFNENVATLFIRPGERVGWRPRVEILPGRDGLALVNQATTAAGGRSWVAVTRAAYGGPIVVRGRLAPRHPGVWRSVPVPDPPRYAAAAFREVLERRGIRVAGGVRSVHRPEDSPVSGRSVFAPAFDGRSPLHVLAVHRSPPLIEILEVINKKSHNFYAEQVLRTVGRVAVGEGSIEGGARAVRSMLECELGGRTPAVGIYDGSGLSPLNRASARAIVDLLAFVPGAPFWEAVWRTLPEAGAPDGLRRMYRTAAEHNLRAKTGTIDRVSALSGYVRAANGERLAFSILSNDVPSTWKAKRVEDAIGARLAAFRRPPAGAPPAEPPGPGATLPGQTIRIP